MTNQHPLTPSPELVQQWVSEFYPPGRTTEVENYVAIQAARWGADQELEACCEFDATVYSTDCADKLRRHRRPKPPSLKERALSELDALENMGTCNSDTIRRALEKLDD